jgi:hypothetical protein
MELERHPLIIGIEKCDQITRSFPDAAIASRTGPDIGDIDVSDRGGVTSDNLTRVVI